MTRRAHVLVVEDDPAMRALLADLLQREGYVVTEAEDGAGLRVASRARPFDVIVVDGAGPGPRGPVFLPALRRAPVIELSAFRDPVPGDESFLGGLRIGALIVAIREALGVDAERVAAAPIAATNGRARERAAAVER